jgi:FtsH-binding integral membrane protein
VILLLVAIVANIFFQIPALSLAISAIAVVLFSAYILYDINRIVQGGEDQLHHGYAGGVSRHVQRVSSACCIC